MLHVLFSLSSAASAADTTWSDPTPAEEAWSTELVARPGLPGVFASLGGTAVVGSTGPLFGEVNLGGGTRLPDTPFGLGFTAQLAGARLPYLDGPVTAGHTAGGEAWVTLRWNRWVHAASLGVYAPLDDDRWYLEHPNEVGVRVVDRYVGHLDAGRTDLDLEVRMGVGEVLPLEVATAASVTTELLPWAAVSLGAEAGLEPSGIGVAGLHLRPLDQLELGASVGVPFPLFSVVAPEVRPSVSAKAWF